MTTEAEDTTGQAPWLDIEPTSVDSEKIALFDSEEDFNGLAVDLLVEVGSWVCIAGNILPAETRHWSRGQAIIGGNLVRLYKLLSGVLDQTCQRRRETAFIFSRLAFECIVNITYLIEFSSQELFESYIRYSLRHERKLRDRINQNIVARGGEVFAIERRMLASIERTACRSGINLDDVSPSAPKNWGEKNLYERADAIGLGQAYLGAFGGPSHSVHGNWMDLLEYHLDDDGEGTGGFQPEFAWHRPRPQPLFMLARLSVEMLSRFLGFVQGTNDAGPLEPRLRDLLGRIGTADKAHEQFLMKRTD